jgi:exopolysaccharide biosynthesis polyprenyl glycosylphosphotransferase
MKKSEIFFAFGRIISDMFAVFGALWFAYLLRMHWYEIQILGQQISLFPPPEFGFPTEKYLKFSLKFTGIIIAILAIHGRYRFRADEKILDEISHIFWGLSAGMAVLLTFFFFSKFPFFSRLIFGLSWIFSLVFIFGGRVFLRILRQLAYQKNIGREKVCIIGDGPLAVQAIKSLHKLPRYQIIGYLTDEKYSPLDKGGLGGISHLGTTQDLEKILKNFSPDEILYCLESADKETTTKAIKLTHIHHKNFRIIPDELSLDLAAVRTSTLGYLPLLTLLNTRIEGWPLVFKNILDRFTALSAITLLSPLLLLISLKIKISDPKAPIFYAAPRVGRNHKHFPCYKFRTMVPDADQKKEPLKNKNQRDDILFKIEDDPRITPFGKFLRKYSLDELPQLFNILQGHMSFIGPRPHLPEEVKRYAPEDRQIFLIKPGLSGFAQINGKSDLTFQEEMTYDIFYMKNWNFWLDAIIFFKSILIAARGENK